MLSIVSSVSRASRLAAEPKPPPPKGHPRCGPNSPPAAVPDFYYGLRLSILLGTVVSPSCTVTGVPTPNATIQGRA